MTVVAAAHVPAAEEPDDRVVARGLGPVEHQDARCVLVIFRSFRNCWPLNLASGIRERWTAGYDGTMRAIERAPWQGEFDPLEGFILHDTEAGAILSEG